MHNILAVWQNIGVGVGLIFIALVVMQKAFDQYAGTHHIGPINFTRHFDRQQRDNKTVPKVTYDPIADATLHKLQERRRSSNVDNGQRRRRDDCRAQRHAPKT